MAKHSLVARAARDVVDRLFSVDRLRSAFAASAAARRRASGRPVLGPEPLESRLYFTSVTIAPVPAAVEGSALTIAATATPDAPGDATTYAWYLFKNGQPYAPPTGVATNGASLTFTPDDAAAWSAVIDVTDAADGTAASAGTGTFHAANVPPTVTATGAATATAGSAYTLSLGTSYPSSDPDADATDGWWVNWGDGSTVEQFAAGTTSATHTFAAAATNTIVASVRDADGVYAAAPLAVQVSNGSGTSGGGTVSFTAAPASASEIDLSYSIPVGTRAELEEWQPGNLNYQTLTNFTVLSAGSSSTARTAAVAVTGLQAATHYSFRLLDVQGQQVQAPVVAAARTNDASPTPTLVAPGYENEANGELVTVWGWQSGSSVPSGTFSYTGKFVPDPQSDPFGIDAPSGASGTGSGQAFTVQASQPLGSMNYQQDVRVGSGASLSPWGSTLLAGNLFPAGPTGLTATPHADGSLTLSSNAIDWSQWAQYTPPPSYGPPHPKQPSQFQIFGVTTDGRAVKVGGAVNLQSNGTFTTTLAAGAVPAGVQQLFVAAVLDQSQPATYSGPAYFPPYSGYSNLVPVPGATISAPAAPLTLTASEAPVNGTPTASLFWDNTANNEAGYYVQRKPDGADDSTWQTVATVPADQSWYSDATLPNATQAFDYRVEAYNNGGVSASPTAVVQTGLAPPAAVLARAAGGTAVRVVWENRSPAATGFLLRVSANGGAYSDLATVGAGVSSYIDAGLSTSTTYKFQVIALQGTTQSSAATTNPVTTGPADTSGWFQVGGVAGDVSLSTGLIPIHHGIAAMVATSPGMRVVDGNWVWAPGWQAAAYEVLAASATVGPTYDFAGNRFVADLASNVGAGTGEGSLANDPKLGLAPTDQVVALEDLSDFDYNDDYFRINVVQRAVPAAPTNPTATPASASEIDLSWTDTAGDQAGFKVERSTDGVNYVLVAALGSDARSYADTGLTGGRAYYYQVIATNPAGDSAPATASAATVEPGSGSITGRVYQYEQFVTPPPSRPPVQNLTVRRAATLNGSHNDGIDYYPPDNSLVVAMDGNSGFTELMPDGSQRHFSSLTMSAYEPKVVSVRPGDGAGFTPGDVFVSGDQGGQIYRIRGGNGGQTSLWLTLPTDDRVSGAMQLDRGGAFSGDLVVLTEDGKVWLVDAQANYAEIASLPGKVDTTQTKWEGLVSLPNDPATWGPLAGTILISPESEPGTFYDVALPQDDPGGIPAYVEHDLPQARVRQYTTSAGEVQQLALVPARSNLYLLAERPDSSVYGVAADQLAPLVGDVLVAEEGFSSSGGDTSGLQRLYWDAASGQLAARPLSLDPASDRASGTWEQIAFGPAGSGPIASALTPLPGRTVYLDLRHDGHYDPGDPSTTTDANGAYSFGNLAPGAYAVGQILQTGWSQVDPAQATYQVAVTADTATAGIDFGDQQAPPVTAPPVITSAPPQVIGVGQTMYYHVAAYDPGGGTLSYRLLMASDGATLDATTDPARPLITWTPAGVARGRFVLEVTDGQGRTALQPFTVRVGLAPVTNVAATAVSDQEVDVRFTGVAGANEYFVSWNGAYQTHFGDGQYVAATAAGGYLVPYTVQGPVSQVFVYAIQTNDPNGPTYYSVAPAAVVPLPAKLPATPAQPSAFVDANHPALIQLQWPTTSTDGTTYNVYRGTTPDFVVGAGSRVNGGPVTPTGNSTVWADPNVGPGPTYYYRITAVNGSGESYPSMAASASLATLVRLTLTPTSVHAVVGQPFTLAVATFTDTMPGTVAADYAAAVAWGDGTTEAGRVTSNGNGQFTVSSAAGHSYAAAGTFPIVVTVVHKPTRRAATADSSGSVTNAALAVTGVSLAPGANAAWSGAVATFTSTDPSAASDPATYASHLSVTVDWNDGTGPLPATAQYVNGRFEVDGSHTYTTSQRFAVQVVVTNPATNDTASATSYAYVSTTAVPQPQHVRAVAVASRFIEILWDADPNASGYTLVRTNPDGSTTMLPTSTDLTTGSHYFDSLLSPNTGYSYVVQEWDAQGRISAPSQSTGVVTTWALPVTPSGLAVTALSDTRVRLTWDSAADPSGLSGWDVLRATSLNGPFTSILPQGSWVPIPNDPGQTSGSYHVTYDDTTATPGTTYWYQVQAQRFEAAAAGATQPYFAKSQVSDTKTATTPNAVGTPAQPTNLQGGYAGQGRVALRWQYTGNTQGLLGFDIYRYRGTSATDPAGLGFGVVGMTRLNTEAPDAHQTIGSVPVYGYADDGIAPGYYFYRVVAVVDDGNGNEVPSAPSDVAAVDATADPSAPPAAPSGLSATLVNDAGGHWLNAVTLAWQDNSVNETGFDVYRNDGSGTWQRVGGVTTDATTYTDSTVVPNTGYQYFVAAVNAADGQGPSLPTSPQSSNTVSVQTPIVGAAPNPPTNLAVDPGPTQTTDAQIALTWTAPADDGVGVGSYYLFRSPAGKNLFSRVAVIPASRTSYADQQLFPATSFDYRLVAVSTTYTQSAAAEVDGAATLPAPAGLPPTVVITAPLPSPTHSDGVAVNWDARTSTDGRITKVTQVRGIVDDLNDDLSSWSLTLTPVDAAGNETGSAVTLAGQATTAGPPPVAPSPVGSSVTGADGLLATLDPSQFPNGQYKLTLTATAVDPATQQSLTQTTTTTVSLASNVKLGGLTLPFTDLSVNVPGGDPITVTRVYDSQQANVLEDFGYGWRLDTARATVTTTATPAEAGGPAAFQPGDLVYITLPSGQQYAFQFFPTSSSYDPGTLASPYDPTYARSTYYAQFVSVDGSHATLRVPGDVYATDHTDLVYQADSGSHPVLTYADDPAHVAQTYGPGTVGGDYQLTTPDGTTYGVNPASDQLDSVTYADGNVVQYQNGQISENGMHLVIDRGGPGRTVQKIYVADANNNMIGQPVTYNVDPTSLDLLGVTDRTNNTTQFQYLDPAHPHFLTGAVDALHVPVLAVAYNKPGQVQSLTNALSQTASIGNGGFNGSNAAEGVKDPAGNTSQSIYDQFGDVTRQIQTVKDAAGNVTGYLVSVTDYAYASSNITDDLSNIFQGNDLGGNVQPGFANGNSLESVSKYQSFFVPGADPSGLRYSQRPTVRSQYTAYDFAGNVTEQKSYLSTTGDGLESLYSVVTYGGYVLGKPQSTTQSLEADDAHTGATLSSRAVSQTSATYDPHTGLLRSTIDPGGVETDYTYTAAGDGVPAGLLLTEARKSSSSGASVPVVANVYYTATDVANHVPGAVAGLLRYSVSGAATLDVAHQLTSDTAGQETYYAYDAAGDVVLQYAFKAWTNPDDSTSRGWVGTTTAYDAAQRATASWQGVYLHGGATDPNTGDPVPDLVTDAAGLPAFDTTKDAAFAGFDNGSPLPGGSTAYTPDGKVDATTDQYGGVTRNTYDADGNLIRTLYPDGTEVRTVYDDMNRVVWQTDRYKTTTAYANGAFADDNANTALATETIYDSLGRVSSTERHTGVLVKIDSATLGTATVATSAATATGTAFSTQQTFYDHLGRTAETVDASGLRTGTIYYPDGTVRYSGPLLTGVSDDPANAWFDRLPADPDPTRYFASFSQYRYNQADLQGNLYDEATDPDGHRTDTYKDAQGRVTRTVYDDGSFTETLYGAGDQPVTRSDLTPPTAAEGWAGVPAGGSETVSIAQRKSGDPVLATYSVYDAAGHLTGVWEPAVLDADPASPTYNQTLRPHWHYAYDAAGNEVSQTDAKGRVTTFAYDENGRRVSRTLPQGQRQTWAYDRFGNVVVHKVYDAPTGGSYGSAVSTTVDVYNAASDGHAGRLVAEYRYKSDHAVANPDAVTTAALDSTAYDEKTAYTYDDAADTSNGHLGLGQPLEVDEYTAAGGASVVHFDRYTYDPLTGQQASITSNEGTVHYAYDPATGQHVRTWTDHSGVVGNDTVYAYDTQGRLQDVYELVLNGTRYATYAGLDPATDRPTFTGGTPPVTDYTYDAAGNLQTETLPDQVRTTYAYDDLNRLTGEDVQDIVDPAHPREMFQQAYDLNQDGTRQDVTDTRYAADGTTVFSQTKVAWQYDGEGRLTDEALAVLAGAATDAPAPYHDQFKFDLANNRVEEDVYPNATATTPASTVAYTYNADDELLTETDHATYATTYGYDASGDQTSKTVTTADGHTTTETDAYGWDARGRMTSATVTKGAASPATTLYTYDSGGVRVSESSGGNGTYYLNDPNNPTGYAKAVEEGHALNGAPTRSYVFGGAVIAQADAANGTLYFVHDGHGSTRALLGATRDAAGHVPVVERYDYDAFGKLVLGKHTDPTTGVTTALTADAAATPWLFGGDGLYDPNSGWTYQLARWRDGFRFTSYDSFAGDPSSPTSLHKYLYAGANSVNAWDPSGHDLVELLVDMGIDGVLNSLLGYAFKPAIHYITSALLSNLIPQSVLDAVEAGLPNVGIIGAGVALNLNAAGDFGGSFEGAIEGVYSSHSWRGALFLADTEKVGLIGENPAALNFFVGLGWNVTDSEDYTGNKIGVTYPFSGFPRSFQSRIFADLSNRVALFMSPFLTQLGASASILDGTFPGYSSGLINQVESDEPALASRVVQFLDKCEITLLWNGAKEVEVLVSFNPLEEANSEDKLRFTGVGLSHSSAAQIYPLDENVPFE